MKKIVESLYNLQTLEMQSRKPDEEQIQALRKGIPADMLAQYDRLRSRGKKGVAVVRNGVCSACHIRVAIGVCHSLALGTHKISCGNCGSILYLPPQEAVAPAPAKAGKAVAAAA